MWVQLSIPAGPGASNTTNIGRRLSLLFSMLTTLPQVAPSLDPVLPVYNLTRTIAPQPCVFPRFIKRSHKMLSIHSSSLDESLEPQSPGPQQKAVVTSMNEFITPVANALAPLTSERRVHRPRLADHASNSEQPCDGMISSTSTPPVAFAPESAEGVIEEEALSEPIHLVPWHSGEDAIPSWRSTSPGTPSGSDSPVAPIHSDTPTIYQSSDDSDIALPMDRYVHISPSRPTPRTSLDSIFSSNAGENVLDEGDPGYDGDIEKG
ncbi:hypothetical protein BV22DRAFT_546101 [Leucogyrophana mollusca]|uniref:Uncharacterized protein n=1 Tax=Leucogyrophana mollusca TaxID=85980 RepID=A0ACB8BFD0_9AGAM|nr:hypothetical protein BV22DRAFT_546101 [Leucogyrophana mollusca]